MDEPLPNPPPELKTVLPFVQRANELRTADAVIAYWCCYYAAQLGISSPTTDTAAKMYLLTLMDTLESLKAKLADNDAVTNDAASAAYVENFALKVFVGADNEDRAGKATRQTPRKFLAASHFLELLKIFGTLEPETAEKIKYAKWKAADIAKAFKEGRKPTAGPAGGDAKEEEAKLETAMGPATDSKEEAEYLAREMAKLTTAAPQEVAPPTVFPESLDAKLSSRVQKLAKGAASAVDFEDLETARIQLRQALDILEGRTTK
uniref:Vacuolar protein sorting-associated protein VTA1 n=1 Tax=Kalmanozyma brasiliensis (strain GHG001) TaxID=1365824 RepID=V5EWA6_KALBG